MPVKNTPPLTVTASKPKRKFRIKDWCEETHTSPATTWRRIKDGTLKVVYYGRIPFIVGGPAGIFDDGDEAA